MRLIVLLTALFALTGCGMYTVETGNVVVKKTFSVVDHDEVGEGFHLKLPIITSVTEFSAKEIPVDFENLQPKAGDNLSLRDLDVSIFYRTEAAQISEVSVKYAGLAERGEDGYYLPGYSLVMREGRSAIYDEVSQIDSLVMHTQRELLASNIRTELQNRLDESDDGVFTITRVVIRALNTDPSIEQAIQRAVQAEKELEAKEVQVRIAQQDALIEIERARGVAQANEIINASLTAEYLQHEVNLALQSFAENGGSTVVIPANMQGFDLILDQGSLRRATAARD